MLNFIYSTLMGIIVIALLVVYIWYLLEWMRLRYRNLWFKILAYLLITFIPVLGLMIYKYSKNWFVESSNSNGKQNE
ncbi:MAG: hypothetical protein N2662_05495 [Bacteroidales bacterium]|nr:hypothetical protein [Bacteroidales bacterium]